MSDLSEKIHRALMGATPRSRLMEHRRFWGDDPPEIIAEIMDAVESGLGRRSVLMDLARLDHYRTLEEWNTDPDTVRGEKILLNAKEGHQQVHGSHEQKGKRWAEYQDALEEVMSANPDMYVTAARREVAEKFGCSPKTVERHTTNPKEK